ncbi:MAG: hypothetical protein ABW166_19525 [Sedimenticola sp.]
MFDAYAASPLALTHDGYAASGARLPGTIRLGFQPSMAVSERMGLEPDAFVNHLRGHKGRPHPVVLGPVGKIRATAKLLGQRFFKGMGESRVLYST